MNPPLGPQEKSGRGATVLRRKGEKEKERGKGKGGLLCPCESPKSCCSYCQLCRERVCESPLLSLPPSLPPLLSPLFPSPLCVVPSLPREIPRTPHLQHGTLQHSCCCCGWLRGAALCQLRQLVTLSQGRRGCEAGLGTHRFAERAPQFPATGTCPCFNNTCSSSFPHSSKLHSNHPAQIVSSPQTMLRRASRAGLFLPGLLSSSFRIGDECYVCRGSDLWSDASAESGEVRVALNTGTSLFLLQKWRFSYK
ncbi:uncharacterized protein [Physcomitrium patens]|uniref:uncharacterized protein n=1 Tax=Physcomitrium patens TaxID=3218 RepID=UPI003CCDCFA2